MTDLSARAVAKLREWPYLVRLLLFVALYFATARAGFIYIQKDVTPIWPPTGVALATLLLFGYELWPGVALGALLANLSNNIPFLPSFAICAGNALGALAAVNLLNRIGRFDVAFRQIKDVIGFVGFGVVLSPVLSATVGVTALYAAGLQSGANYGETWWTWWLSDAMGALVVAPVLLAWGVSCSPESKRDWRHTLEAAVLVALALSTSLLAYSNLLTTANYYPLAYLTYPFLLWAAIRFSVREVVTLNLLISIIAVWVTAQQAGPFIGEALDESILSLASHIGVAQITAMLITVTFAERQQKEAVIKQINADLEQRVRERTAELSAANSRLTELDRLKSKFIDDASHEMRTPLTIANTDAYLLEHGKPDKQKQYLRELKDQIERLTHFADTILDASYLDLMLTQGKVTFEPVDLNAVVEETIAAFAPRIEALGLTLTVDLARDLPSIHAAHRHMSQATAHLVANAIWNTDEGSIDISTGLDAAHKQIFLCVRDTGKGIHPDDLPHIFERFYRGRDVAESHIPGSGLGLAITQEIIELHKGHIEAQSELGKGSTFTVWLPTGAYLEHTSQVLA